MQRIEDDDTQDMLGISIPDRLLTSLYNVVARNIENGQIDSWYISEVERQRLKQACEYLREHGLII